MIVAIYSPEALQDLAEAWDYVAAYSPDTADRFLDDVAIRVNTLEQFPYMGMEREEIAPELRSVMVGRFVLFYQPCPTAVRIVRFLHGSRDYALEFSNT
jgi:toxin ParE1/3/4